MLYVLPLIITVYFIFLYLSFCNYNTTLPDLCQQVLGLFLMFFNQHNSLIIYCFNAVKRTRGPAGERAGHGSTIGISIVLFILFYFIYSLFILLSVRSLCLCAAALPSVCLCVGCVLLHNRLAAPTNRIVKRSLFSFLFWIN